MTAVHVRVAGLRETQKALRETSDQAPKAIQSAHKSVAEIVAARARSYAAGTTLPDRIKAVGTTRVAAVRFYGHRPKGTVRTTDAALQEWGGRAPLFGNREHWFEVKRKNKRGYFIYPAVRSTREKVMDVYLARLDEAINRHFTQQAIARADASL